MCLLYIALNKQVNFIETEKPTLSPAESGWKNSKRRMFLYWYA